MKLSNILYKIKYVLFNIIKRQDLNKYDKDVIIYTDKFKEKHRWLMKTREGDSRNGSTILFFSILNSPYSLNIESIIARKLEEFGFKIVILTFRHLKKISDNIHKKIYGLDNVLYLEDFLSISNSSEAGMFYKKVLKINDVNEIKNIRYKNTLIGIHSLASYSANIQSGKVIINNKSKKYIAKILKNSCRIVDGIEKIMESINPDKVLAVDKGTVGVCAIFYESIHRKIDYLQWASCHEPNSIIVKRYNTENYREHPFSVSEKTWNNYKKNNENYNEFVLDYLKKGYLGGKWFEYKKLSTNKSIISKTEIIERLKLNSAKKIAIIFSHILNDANFFFGEDLFKGGFTEWLVKTAEVAGKNKDVNWLLKLHPANIYRRSNMKYKGEYGEIIAIKEALGKVPENITVIPADIDINPYSFFKIADYGITVRGTIGAELPCFGVSVLTAGTGRYSGRGFTIDSNSVEEYLDKIANIQKIPALSDNQRKLALKHAYLFFKERPAKYNTYIHDIYPYPQGHPLNRDIEIIDKNLFENKDLVNLSNFISNSKDEDYLSSKTY